MASQEMLDFFAEQGKRDYERWRSTHNKPEPSEWLQVTTGYMTKYRTAIQIHAVRAVEDDDGGVVICLHPEGGSFEKIRCLETYDEIMSQLGVKPIERKEVKQ